MRFKRKASSIIGLLVVAGTAVAVLAVTPALPGGTVVNGDFRQSADNVPTGYSLTGAAAYRYLGNPGTDNTGYGVRLDSTQAAGGVSQRVTGIDSPAGKWFRFSFRGLPQANFSVADDALEMKVLFFGADGKTAYDGKSKQIYPQIEEARKDLTVNGDNHTRGAEVWQTYSLDFAVPFPQVKQFDLSVDFQNGNAKPGTKSATFMVTDFSLTPIPDPPAAVGSATTRPTPAIVPAYDHLIPLGGRWYYAAAESGETTAPAKFDSSNADRLLYHDAGYSAPFANNTGAWIHKGNLDRQGNAVEADQWIDDNVTITIDAKSLIIHTRGLPNHPTGQFPGENPNSIQEQNGTYYLPLNPTVNPKHIVTDKTNTNHALNMGPIGIAINGVVFYNPFDAGSQDASNIMDYCCGHPDQMGRYHYHKYPICVNSPWADDGKQHSPLIGFAFDGFPIYGPYESADLMAKDVKGEHALNDFNLHFDKDRGWHYHVTPGQFPYLIGGYWGTIDPRDAGRRGMGGGPGGGGPGGGRTGRAGPPQQ
jgi:hypothetical protein